MADQQEDLRSTEDSIRKDADHLKTLEDRKAALEPDDERVAELSEQAERVSVELREKATAERELAEDIQASG
jgi:hypothetical protein